MSTIIGTVVSKKTPKTAVVVLVRQHVHPLYKKISNREKRLLVHVEDESIAENDKVKIAQSKPYSKHKHYKIVGKV